MKRMTWLWAPKAKGPASAGKTEVPIVDASTTTGERSPCSARAHWSATSKSTPVYATATRAARICADCRATAASIAWRRPDSRSWGWATSGKRTVWPSRRAASYPSGMTSPAPMVPSSTAARRSAADSRRVTSTPTSPDSRSVTRSSPRGPAAPATTPRRVSPAAPYIAPSAMMMMKGKRNTKKRLFRSRRVRSRLTLAMSRTAITTPPPSGPATGRCLRRPGRTRRARRSGRPRSRHHPLPPRPRRHRGTSDGVSGS